MRLRQLVFCHRFDREHIYERTFFSAFSFRRLIRVRLFRLSVVCESDTDIFASFHSYVKLRNHFKLRIIQIIFMFELISIV